MSQTEKNDKESIARSQLPYKAEYCKTSRGKCKKCQTPMQANSLKLAIMVKSRFHDGYDSTFFHVNCFFQMRKPNSVAEISSFESLKYEDQKMIEDGIKTNGLSILGKTIELATNESNQSKSKKRIKKGDSKNESQSNDSMFNCDDFSIEYAKSNRSKCKKCDSKIDKDSVRIGKLDYASENPWTTGPVPRWYHVNCFADSLPQVQFFGQIEKVKGFSKIDENDQAELKEKVKPFKVQDLEAILKKPKKEDKTGTDEGSEDELKKLKKQSDLYYKLREQVNSIKRKDLEEILKHMNQRYHFKSSSQIVDAATDVLMFGPIKECPQCKKEGGFVLRSGGYICTLGSESDPCTYETREPKRGLPDIPEDIVERYPYFEDHYKFYGKPRIFSSDFIKAVEQKEAEDNNIVQDDAPLEGLNIGVISWKAIDMDKALVQKRVTILGGSITTSLDKSLYVLITSKNYLEKDEPRVMVAKELQVPFADVKFLFEISSKNDVSSSLKKHLLSDFSQDIDTWTSEKRSNGVKLE